MKKSTMVTLLFSGRLLTGCDDNSASQDWSTQGDSTAVTNNTYVPGRGYYHAPYYGWYEYPYNFYRPGFGYYHGGFYSRDPEAPSIIASRPTAGARAFSSAGRAAPEAHGISRGGFGSSGRASS
jgi:hypothetical protein